MRLLVLVLDKQERKTLAVSRSSIAGCLHLLNASFIFLRVNSQKTTSFKTTSMASYPLLIIQNNLQVFFLLLQWTLF